MKTLGNRRLGFFGLTLTMLAFIPLDFAPMHTSYAADDDATQKCQQQCRSKKRACMVGRNATDCPGTGLFGDPEKAAHDQCVRDNNNARNRCEIESESCGTSCDGN
jgi:hypothetical protein